MGPFQDGEPYHESFQTTAGWVLLIADIRIVGRTLEMHNILIEPIDAKSLSVGTAEMYAIRSKLFGQARQAGYTTLVIEGRRTSGANPGRAVWLRRNL